MLYIRYIFLLEQNIYFSQGMIIIHVCGDTCSIIFIRFHTCGNILHYGTFFSFFRRWDMIQHWCGISGISWNLSTPSLWQDSQIGILRTCQSPLDHCWKCLPTSEHRLGSLRWWPTRKLQHFQCPNLGFFWTSVHHQYLSYWNRASEEWRNTIE